MCLGQTARLSATPAKDPGLSDRAPPVNEKTFITDVGEMSAKGGKGSGRKARRAREETGLEWFHPGREPRVGGKVYALVFPSGGGKRQTCVPKGAQTGDSSFESRSDSARSTGKLQLLERASGHGINKTPAWMLGGTKDRASTPEGLGRTRRIATMNGG